MNAPTTKGTTTSVDWQANLQPILAALEIERQSAQKTVWRAAIIIGVLAILSGIPLLSLDNFASLYILLIPIFIGIAIFAFVYSNATSTYRNGFKSGVLPQLVSVCAQETGGSLNYSAGVGIPESEFRQSDLFQSPDRYSSEDLTSGKIGATSVRFSEVHAEDRQTRGNGKNTHTEYVTIFKGLFFVADFNKTFQGATFVLPDTAEQVFGRFAHNLQQFGAKISMSGRELVKLEDPNFERQFVVYSTDQVEARYILSPSLMQRLMDFRAQCKTEFRLAFSGGNMIIAIPVGVGWLEPPSLSTPLTIQSLGMCLVQLRFACGIVSDMDLNTRIWSK